MGRTAVVLGFEKRNENGVRFATVKCDFGGGETVTAEYYPPPGLFCEPLDGDTVLLEQGRGTGEWFATGFIDPSLEPLTSERGESVVYSRSAPGVVAAKILLLTDGSIVINDEVTISASGAITTTDDISTDGEVSADGHKLSDHDHGYLDATISGTLAQTTEKTDVPAVAPP